MTSFGFDDEMGERNVSLRICAPSETSRSLVSILIEPVPPLPPFSFTIRLGVVSGAVPVTEMPLPAEMKIEPDGASSLPDVVTPPPPVIVSDPVVRVMSPAGPASKEVVPTVPCSAIAMDGLVR